MNRGRGTASIVACAPAVGRAAEGAVDRAVNKELAS